MYGKKKFQTKNQSDKTETVFKLFVREIVFHWKKCHKWRAHVISAAFRFFHRTMERTFNRSPFITFTQLDFSTDQIIWLNLGDHHKLLYFMSVNDVILIETFFFVHRWSNNETTIIIIIMSFRMRYPSNNSNMLFNY